MKNNLIKASILALIMGFVGCGSDDDATDDNGTTEATYVDTEVAGEFIANYASIASANYSDTYNTAVDMQTAIDAFLASPSEATLEAAQDAWLYARDFYGQTEAYREANGPIDNEDLLGTEGQINAWPLDESFIDYVSDNAGGYSNVGIIAGSETINATNLASLNGDGDDIATGWHAIEFLLWGQDLNYNFVTHTSDNYANAGERPYTDYTTADYADRRAAYLKVVTDLLIADLKDLNDTWAEGGSYRTAFEALDQEEALKNILNGVGFISNGEVALERLDPAIDEGQENEHSCFSDNTTQDMWANVNGLNNIIVGSYTTEGETVVSGTSLIDLVNELDTTVATSLEDAAANTIAKLAVLTDLDITFDEVISLETLESGGTAGDLSSALKAQGTAIADAAEALAISITID